MMGISADGNDPFPGTPALSNANDPLGQAIQKEAAANPQTVSVMHPTKFGSLLKILGPMVEGGMIGGFSGKGHPGGGFGAAQDFYEKRRQDQLRNGQFQRQLAQTQAQIDERSRTNDIAQQRANSEDWGAPVQGQDAQGNPGFFVRNRKTGETKQVNGFTPSDKPDKTNSVMTDQGLMSVTGATATPVTIPGVPSGAPSGAPQGPPASTGVVQFAGQTSPMYVARKPGAGGPSLAALRRGGVPGGAPSGSAPLMPPGYGKPQHQNDFEQYYDKYLDDNGLDDTSANQLKARALYAGAERKPTDAADFAKQDKARNSLLKMQNGENAKSEQTHTKAVADLNKRKWLMEDQDYETAQQEIEDAKSSRDEDIQNRYETLAQQEGVDLTQRGQSATVPNAPPNGARSNGGKVAGAADVAAWAKRQGISVAAASRQFKAKGYAVQGSPQ